MSRTMHLVVGVVSACALTLGWSACPEAAKRPIGASCSTGAECESGLCAGEECLDPNADEDGDGLANFIEDQVGSDIFNPDTDGDGRRDDEELEGVTNVDTDGDGLPDVLESALLDPDGDCIPDQYDAENAVANADLSPMRDLVCSDLGVCAGQDRALFGVLCPEPARVAVCDYSLVVGYEAPEVSCDGLDQSCDGVADDGFPDQDADRIADCVDDDNDNDTVADAVDNCPRVTNADQADAQADGIGDACAAEFALAFSLAPTLPLAAGAPFDATVTVHDASDAVPVRFHGTVTLSLAGGGALGALTGTLTATAVDGVATFSGLAITAPGEDLTLVAQSGDLGEGESAPFAVVPGELAELRVSGAPITIVAGTPATFTLTALDAFENVLTTYAGALSVGATDPQADLPAPLTFTAADAGEVAVAGLTLRTAGTQTVNIIDIATETVLASLEVAVTNAPAATFALTGLPAELVAGVTAPLTVTALDAFGNVAIDFTGVARFAADDVAATLPSDHHVNTVDAGVFSTDALVLRTAGAHTVSVAAGVDDAVRGSATVTVTHSAAAGLVVTALDAPITAGAPFSVEVRVVDAFGNLVTDFTGPVALTSDDPLAVLPGSYTFTAADQGVHVFTGVTLVSAGDHTLGASASGGTATGGVGVTVASASELVFALGGIPAPTTAGVPFDLTVTVKDVFGNPVTAFTGTVALLSSDPQATLPPARSVVPADGGTVTFTGVVLVTAGAQTLTAADSSNAIAQSAPVDVIAATAATLGVSGPASVTAGTPFAITVAAQDAFGNAATGFSSTLVFASSDDGATLPADGTFPSGTGAHTFSGLVLTTAGAHTVTVGDAGNGELSASLNVTVTPAAAASVGVSAAPTAVTAGAPFGLTATLYDRFGNVASGYTGQLAVTVSDPSGAVPAAHTFSAADAGVHAFGAITLETAGQQTVTVAAPANSALEHDLTLTVNPASAVTLTVTASDPTVAAGVTTSLVVRARDAFGNRATGYTGTVHFSAPDDPQATLPANATFTASDTGERVVGGLILRTIGTQTVNAVDTTTAAVSGSASIVVQQGSQIVYELTGLPATATAGAPLVPTLSVRDLFGNPITDYTGTVTFTAVDAATGQPVPGATLPGSYTFKVTDHGVHAFSALTLTSARNTTVRVAEVGTPTLNTSVIVTVTPATMARLALSNAPTGVTAGATFSVRVTAYDAYDNVATGYTGPVTFGASASGATLPSDGTLTAGTRNFTGLALTLAGATTLSVADGAAVDEITLTVTHGAPAHLELSALPTNVTAGVAQSLTATIRDAYGNVATGFIGSATVATNDPAVTGATIDFQAAHQGQRPLTVTFNTAGSRQVTVDAGGALSASRSTTVVAAAAASLALTGPATTTAGTPLSLTVTARDAFGNLATGYSATLAFTSSDPAATLPASGAFPAGSGSQSYGGVALKTAGAARTVTVTDPARPTLTATLTLGVTPAAPATLSVSGAPTSVTAGQALTLPVTVLDAYGNVATNATSQLALTTSDSAADVPGAHTLIAGDAGTFTFTGLRLRTAGQQTVTVTATGATTLTKDLSITVNPAVAADLLVTPSASTVGAGTAISVVVRAVDAFGNRATAYRGTVHFAAPGDAQATLPANTTFSAADAGEHVFGGVVLRTTGAQALNVTDTVTASLDGTTTVTVQQGAQIVFALTGLPTTTTAGTSLSATLSVKDSFGNPITSYTGTVTFSATDAASGQAVTGATLPANYTFTAGDQGAHTFTGLVLTSARNTTVRVSQLNDPTLNAGAVVGVSPAAMSRLTLSNGPTTVTAGNAFGVRVTAYDAYDNVATGYTGPVAFSASRTGATLPSDGTLSAGTRSFTGLVFTLAGDTVLTVSGGAASTQLTLPVVPAAASSLTLSALAASVTAGAAQSLTATVKDPWGNVATGFVGTATVVTTDPAVSPTTLDFLAAHLGVRSFSVTFKTAGARQVTVDAGGSVTATRSTTVVPAAASSYLVGALPAQVTAGVKQTLTITLYDPYSNVATGGYAGAFTLSTTDPAAVLSATSLTIGAADLGAKSFDVTFKTAGTRTVTIAQATLGNVDRATTVRAAAPSALYVSDLPPAVTAGSPAAVVVRVADAFGNTVSNYGGLATVSSTDDAVTLSPGAELRFPANQPATVTLTATFVTAGTQRLDLLDSALGVNGVDTTSTTVNAAVADHLAWLTQPSAGEVGVALPQMRVAALDTYGNVATSLAPTTVSLALGRNAGPGHLGGTVSAATASGVASFAAAQIDRPGLGYDLVATATGFSAVRSARFDGGWQAPTIVGTPLVSGGGGCRTLDYAVKQVVGAPADVLVEFRVGTGLWRRATQAPSTAGDTEGATALATSAAGEPHTFGWDAFADLGRQQVPSVTLRVTPRVGRAVGAPASTATFSVDFAWSLSQRSEPLSADLTHGALATGDFDNNGLPDVVVAGRAANAVDLLYQVKRNEFVLTQRLFDITDIDVVAVRPWREGAHDHGFFLLDRLDSDLFVMQRTVQGEAAVAWSFTELDACPDAKSNTAVAMAVGHTEGSAVDEVFVTCRGTALAAPSVAWASYGAQNSWAPRGNLTLPKAPTAVEVADLGHNGWRDLVLGDDGGLRTAISQYGDGFCLSTACGAQAVEMAAPIALAVADFDADGQLDVVAVHGNGVASYVAGDLVVDAQGRPVRFLASTATPLGLSIDAGTVAVGDVDTDGLLDLIVGSSTKDEVQILRGLGDGSFASAGVVATGAGGAELISGIVVRDLDLDGQLDAVIARRAPGEAALARIDGAPIAQCRPAFETAGAARFAVDATRSHVADVDADGRPDTLWAATAGSAATGLLVGLGDGAGGYLQNYTAYATSFDPSDLAVGDLNGDGLMDAVLADGYTDNATVLLQSAAQPGTFSRAYLPSAFADVSAPSMNVIDIDNDGREDLIFLGEGAVRPYYQSATGVLQAGTSVAVTGTTLRGLATADVNKDGYQDLALFRYLVGAGAQVCVLRSKGLRVWESAATMPCSVINNGVGSVTLVDLDRDGVEELVYVNEVDSYQPAQVHVRRQANADSGLFGAPEVITSCYGADRLQVADANGDDRLDLVVGCGGYSGTPPYAVEMYVQAADGTFRAAVGGLGTPWGYPRSLAVTDVTGDQRPDMLYGGTVTRQAANGGGALLTPSAWPASASTSSLIAVVDLDGDTLPDVVTALGATFSVVRQVAPGKFGDPVTYTMSGVSWTTSLAVADVDNDGRPDVLAGVYPPTGFAQLRIHRQLQNEPAQFDTVNGVTTLTAVVSGQPVSIAVDDVTGSGAASLLVSWGSGSTVDDFTVYIPTDFNTYTPWRSDPYTSSTFPTSVVDAGFGWFGATVREPIVAGLCTSQPCAVVGAAGICDIPGSYCYRSKTVVNLGAGAAAPLYTSIGGLAVADLDRDGLDDLVASLGGANNNHVYAVVQQDVTKPGNFLPLKTFQGARAAAGRVRLVDVNHDGLLDIVGQYDGGVGLGYELLLGRGDGTAFDVGFAVATALTDAETQYAWDDIDRDGWPDLVTAGPGSADGVILVAPQR